MDTKPSAKFPVKSLAKALRILEAVGRYENGSTITALSKELKMGKSTVHRLLATMRDFDLVWYDAEGATYALGAKILRWSDLLVRQNLLVRHGVPILQKLVQQCRETANLAVLDGTDILYVAQCESSERLRMSGALGGRLPAHCTALGKILLSTLDDEQFDQRYPDTVPLKPMTPNSILDRHRLKEHLQKIHQEGVALDFEENTIGSFCMAALVHNHTGRPIAAISISMPLQRLRGDNLNVFKEHLLEAAASLSAELGYEAPKPELPVAAPEPAVLADSAS